MNKTAMIALTAASAVISGAAAADESGIKISKWDAAPVFTGDGWEFKIGGRVQFDYSNVDTDVSGADWSATELRRLRLGVSGKFGDNLKYKVELNTDSSEDVNLEDGYLDWKPTGGHWSVKAGQFKTPNSLDEQTSSRFISVLERAAFTDAFQFNRRLGVALHTSGDKYTFMAGVFGDNVNEDAATEGFALAARATMTPIKTETQLVHVGASVRYRDAGDDQGDFRYRQRPVSHIPGRILSTGAIADSDVFVGAEAAGIFSRFWTAGEYGATFADCSAAAACADDPDFDGGYGEVGVFFGGVRTYKSGKFNRPRVDHPVTEGGAGALALVARYDAISLNDSAVNGGSYDSYILGADWWATKYTRLSLNLFKVDADLGASASGLDPNFAALVAANAPKEDVKGAIVRAQFDF
ncbi:MAG: OprO/OprP family phosphate-selective porin [Parvularculaceae bacterium]